MKKVTSGSVGCLVSLLTLAPTLTWAQSDDTAALRRQLEDQRKLIQQQQEQINQQSQTLDRMEQLLNEMAGKETANLPADTNLKPVVTAEPTQTAPPRQVVTSRDDVGDLNREAIRAGDFPGSFRIPGPGKVSLSIGGFIKTAAIVDSNAEVMGADFVPATLGTRRPDQEGAFSIDSTITRLHLDARAPTENGGKLRAYLEADLNNANDGTLGLKLRHAYGTWTTGGGMLTVGHTWSTLMDLKILPEGMTEPTLSGPIFMRQPQIRWSQKLGELWTLHAAIEDPSSNDVFSDNPIVGQTSTPDGILGIEVDRPEIGHLRLNGILRNIEVDLPSGKSYSDRGWGLALSGHFNLFGQDRLNFSGVYGEGLGRYLLGILSTDGSAINPANDQFGLRDNWGVQSSYSHHWSAKWRSTAMFGYARSEPLDWQSDRILKSSTYAAANLIWQVLPYLSVGAEYSYGKRENKSGADLDNHRVVLGVQVY
jgi:hypothetical protein